jgi:hypothetical protein
MSVPFNRSTGQRSQSHDRPSKSEPHTHLTHVRAQGLEHPRNETDIGAARETKQEGDDNDAGGVRGREPAEDNDTRDGRGGDEHVEHPELVGDEVGQDTTERRSAVSNGQQVERELGRDSMRLGEDLQIEKREDYTYFLSIVTRHAATSTYIYPT